MTALVFSCQIHPSIRDPYDTPATPLSRPGSNTKLSDYPSTQPLGETFVILHQYCIIFSQPTLYHISKRRQDNRVFKVVATTERAWLAVDSPLPETSTHLMSVSSDIYDMRVVEMEVSRFISLHAVENIPEYLESLSFRQLRKEPLAWNERLRARLQITQLQELKWSTRTMQVTRLSTAACRSICRIRTMNNSGMQSLHSGQNAVGALLKMNTRLYEERPKAKSDLSMSDICRVISVSSSRASST